MKKTTVKYQYPDFSPQKLSKHHVDRQSIEEVPDHSLVLDIGCATGFMGKYLREKKGCQVIGLDIRSAEAKIARKNLDHMILANFEDRDTEGKIKTLTGNKKFDVILATSLIEHLVSPQAAIQKMGRLIKPKGKLVLSTPNIAHWSIRWMLLNGKFDYTEYGILDNTHLHFFTLKTFRELLEKNGFMLQKMKIDAEGGGFPRLSIALSPFFPGLFAYQMVVVASKR